MRIATEPSNVLFRDRQVQKSVLVLREEKRDALLGYDNFCADAVVVERHADDTLTVLFLESSHKWACGGEICRGQSTVSMYPLCSSLSTRRLGLVFVGSLPSTRGSTAARSRCTWTLASRRWRTCAMLLRPWIYPRALRLRQFLQGTTLDSATMTSKLASMSAARRAGSTLGGVGLRLFWLQFLARFSMLFAVRVLGFHAWAFSAAATIVFSHDDEQAGEYVRGEDEPGSTLGGVELRLFVMLF